MKHGKFWLGEEVQWDIASLQKQSEASFVIEAGYGDYSHESKCCVVVIRRRHAAPVPAFHESMSSPQRRFVELFLRT